MTEEPRTYEEALARFRRDGVPEPELAAGIMFDRVDGDVVIVTNEEPPEISFTR